MRGMATQSGDDTVKPTALAKIHLEDGTTLTGTSFGSHTSVEGEVSCLWWWCGRCCLTACIGVASAAIDFCCICTAPFYTDCYVAL